MNIAFWLTSTTRHIQGDNWGKIPLGGAEVSAYNLGMELLRKGHSITFYLQRCDPFDKDRLHIRKHGDIGIAKHDYFICVRPHVVLSSENFNKKILWSGDAFDQSSMNIFWEKDIANSVDAYVFKTKWQRDKIVEKFFFIDNQKTHVIYNGVNDALYNGLTDSYYLPQRNRFIHASTWYRGVYNFIDIWPKIIESIPEAEIHVFSKTSLYSESNPRDQQYGQIAEKLCQLPGVILREPVPQNIIIQEMKKAWLMLYPNTGFVESSCGAALQSICAGTPVITTARAGLPETIGTNGILIEENEHWQRNFVKETVNLWTNKEQRNHLSLSGQKRLTTESWKKKAIVWEEFLKSL